MNVVIKQEKDDPPMKMPRSSFDNKKHTSPTSSSNNLHSSFNVCEFVCMSVILFKFFCGVFVCVCVEFFEYFIGLYVVSCFFF